MALVRYNIPRDLMIKKVTLRVNSDQRKSQHDMTKEK